MHKSVRLLVIALIVCLPVAVSAEATPEATKWLDKMGESFEKAPFRFTFSVDQKMEQMGQTMDMSMTGPMIYSDPKHTRMELEMTISVPGMAQGMNMSMLGVSDGEFMWMEMNNPMMGGKQVMKLALDKVDAMSEQSPGMGGATTMDPISQIQKLSDDYDIELVGVAGGRVTLRATKIGAAEEAAPEGADPAMPRVLIVVLDEATGMPVEMQAGEPEPVMVMRFSDFEFLEEDALEPNTFTYTPPEGVQVMDLGGMAGGGQ
jgi:outer membrane lipoprotein-sorting protein